MITYKDELLMHYGIKGQKHGRRRFQNEDGSLTPAGKLRYLDQSSKKNSGSYVRLKESGSEKNESVLDRVEIKDRTGGAASSAAAGAFVAAKYGEGTHRGYKSSYRSSGPDTSPDRKYDYNVANLDKNGSILNTEHYKRVYDEKGNSHYELASLGVPRMSTAGVTKTYNNGEYDIFFNDEKNKPNVIQRTDDKSFPNRFSTYEGYWKDGKKRTIVYDREQGKIIYDEQGHGFPKGSKGEAAINAVASGAASAARNAVNNSAAQKKASAESERYRKMTEQGQKQIDAVKAKQEDEKKAAQEAEKYRKMTEYGNRQMNEAVAERHIWQNNAVHDLQERMLKANRATKSNEEVKLVQDNGTVYYMGIDRTGAPYFKNANHQPVYESEKRQLSRRYNLITDSRALAAKKANYSAKTMSKAEKEQQQKTADKLRRESAAKAKQRLTPEKADKVKKALAEKRTKKVVTKPNAKKNRREEIQ